MKKWILGALFSTAMVACGSSHDNVGACKAFLTSVKCGTFDISNQYNCDAYANTSCDIAPYFDCLSEHYVCTNGQYDTTKLSTAGECANKATCQ
jgi:hypothetical protein